MVAGAGPAGSLLFSCRTDNSMSNPLGIVHGGVTASLVDTCMGVTCTAQCGGAPTPTVTMLQFRQTSSLLEPCFTGKQTLPV